MKKIIIKQKDLYNISPLLKGVMDMAFDESCIMDKDGYIIHCSDSSPLIWNRPNEESIGMHISELDSASPYPELLSTGKAVMGKIHIINGRTCITHMIPLFDKKGEILGAFGVIIFRGMEKLKNLVRTNVFDDQSMNLFNQLSRAEASNSFDDIHTRSPKMLKLIQYAKKLATSKLPILITGETGTGKELFANAIHTYANSKERAPFVRINCNAIPPEALEAELFGYERGAFASAYSTKIGKFEIAGNGTILLDEIGSLDTTTQAKLLRVIEEREFERVGGNTLIPLNARIIASTNCNVMQRVRENLFRQDLYFRLNTIELSIPPLRERLEDIDLLIEYFLGETERTFEFSEEAIDWMKQYKWLGNVRQLKNLITRLDLLEDESVITLKMVKTHLGEDIDIDGGMPSEESTDINLNRTLLDQKLLVATLKDTGFNISATAKRLKVSRNTIYNRIKKYGIDFEL